MVGKYQNVFEEIDVEYAKRKAYIYCAECRAAVRFYGLAAISIHS